MAKILNVKEGMNVVPEIINAIASGYRDDIVLDELAQAVENKSLSRQQFESAIEALELYAERFTSTVKNIANSMKQFEFNDEQPVLKNRRLDLAQQVIRDLDGFNKAVQEYDDEGTEGKEEQPKEEEKSNAQEAEKPSYKDFFLSKLKEFNINDPANLKPEQWNEIADGWKELNK